MGEVVVLSSEELEGKESDNVEKKVKEKKGGEGSSSGLMRWEKFLPKMALRVLLVEADDSTGQIVAALLRKCSYKVAAVADGLKAWEVLKGRPHKIDLILTEVDLPSISGYALLTLIMEHEICRNIPVIMMSPEDSVSTVYQCMLRGASDYLVKPLRINELRTLWQHVWRRQRSSCTKPDLEAESAGMENKQECFQSNEISPRDAEMQKHERLIKGNWEDGYAVPSGKDVESEAAKKDVNTTSQASGNNDAPINSTIEPAGSSGAFYGLHNCRNEGSYGTSKFDSSPQGGLSLSRSHLPSFESKTGEGRKMLKHSNTSAFTRYVSRPVQHLNPTSARSSCQHKEYTADSDRTLVNAYKSDTLRPPLGAQNVHLSLATSQSEQSPLPDLHTEQRTFSVPVPVSSIQGNYISTIYDSVLPPVFSSPSGLSPLTSPSSAGRQVHVTALNHTAIKSNSSAWFPIQTKNNQEHDRYHMEEPAQISPATDQSPNSSFCNVGVNQHNSSRYDSICGTSGNIDPAVAVKAPKELNNDGSSHRLSLREAALIKFRQKRKDRCYEKKVRYESRKKLAEQRPRVKGQFVRQVHVDTLPVEPEDPKVNSADA